jgi:hypothetical protein
MIFLAITPNGLADALRSATENDHVWCGSDAMPEEQREALKTKVSVFTYSFTGAGAGGNLQGAIWTMEDHHPGHTVWVEQVPSE